MHHEVDLTMNRVFKKEDSEFDKNKAFNDTEVSLLKNKKIGRLKKNKRCIIISSRDVVLTREKDCSETVEKIVRTHFDRNYQNLIKQLEGTCHRCGNELINKRKTLCHQCEKAGVSDSLL